MEQQKQILDLITKYLLSFNASAPVIFGLVSTVAILFKGITGTGHSLKDCALIIEGNLSTNDRVIRDEIQRLKNLVA